MVEQRSDSSDDQWKAWAETAEDFVDASIQVEEWLEFFRLQIDVARRYSLSDDSQVVESGLLRPDGQLNSEAIEGRSQAGMPYVVGPPDFACSYEYAARLLAELDDNFEHIESAILNWIPVIIAGDTNASSIAEYAIFACDALDGQTTAIGATAHQCAMLFLSKIASGVIDSDDVESPETSAATADDSAEGEMWTPQRSENFWFLLSDLIAEDRDELLRLKMRLVRERMRALARTNSLDLILGAEAERLTPEEKDSDEWIGPRTQLAWAALFEISVRTFRNWIKARKLVQSGNGSSGRIYLRKRDLPEDVIRRFQQGRTASTEGQTRSSEASSRTGNSRQ